MFEVQPTLETRIENVKLEKLAMESQSRIRM